MIHRIMVHRPKRQGHWCKQGDGEHGCVVEERTRGSGKESLSHDSCEEWNYEDPFTWKIGETNVSH